MGPQTRQIDEARRLLYTSLDIQFRESYSLLCETETDAIPKGALYSFYEESSLPWKYRAKDWFRWRNVREKLRPESQLDKVDSQSASVLEPVKQSLSDLNEIKAYLDNQDILSARYSDFVSVEYFAILGSILHSGDTESGREPTTLSSMLKKQTSRILCNTVPYITNVLNKTSPFKTINSLRRSVLRNDGSDREHYPHERLEKLTFLIRFSPSPWSNPDDFEKLPTIELALDVSPATGTLSHPHISAISSYITADILMPDAAADIRYVRRATIPIKSQTADVDAFLKSSNLDIMGHEVLQPASKATFEIPAWMINNTNDALGFVDKQYVFTNLEFRSTLHFEWKGLPLLYSEIEAGSTGGKRSEVMIQYQAGTKLPQEGQKMTNERIEHFEDQDSLEYADEEDSFSASTTTLSRSQTYRSLDDLVLELNDIPPKHNDAEEEDLAYLDDTSVDYLEPETPVIEATRASTTNYKPATWEDLDVHDVNNPSQSTPGTDSQSESTPDQDQTSTSITETPSKIESSPDRDQTSTSSTSSSTLPSPQNKSIPPDTSRASIPEEPKDQKLYEDEYDDDEEDEEEHIDSFDTLPSPKTPTIVKEDFETFVTKTRDLVARLRPPHQ